MPSCRALERRRSDGADRGRPGVEDRTGASDYRELPEPLHVPGNAGSRALPNDVDRRSVLLVRRPGRFPGRAGALSRPLEVTPNADSVRGQASVRALVLTGVAAHLPALGWQSARHRSPGIMGRSPARLRRRCSGQVRPGDRDYRRVRGLVDLAFPEARCWRYCPRYFGPWTAATDGRRCDVERLWPPVRRSPGSAHRRTSMDSRWTRAG